MREQPYSLEAEKSVLGAVFLDPYETFPKVKKYISAPDFYYPAHAELFTAFEKMLTENAVIDLVTLKDTLEKRGTYDEIGGVKYLMELANFVPTTETAGEYAKQVRDRSDRRKIIKICDTAITACGDIALNPSETLDKLLAGATETRGASEITDFGTALCDYADFLTARKRSGKKQPGITTGFYDLDVFLGGLEDAKLYVVGGRPAMGKTAFGYNVMTSIAKAGGTVMLFSMEMNKNEVMKRIVSSVANIDSYKLKMAQYSDDEFSRMSNIFQKINEDSIYICDDNYQTAETIYSKCLDVNAQLKSKRRRINAVVIDYLQLISSPDRRIDRRNAVGDISRSCKIMAKRLNCPVILISQLSRANEARENKRPQLSDLRESGDIEQDADAVMFLYREEYYKPSDANKGKAELIVAKNRDGEVGKIRLNWYPETVSFKGAAR